MPFKLGGGVELALHGSLADSVSHPDSIGSSRVRALVIYCCPASGCFDV